jgi:hypothetical protein
VGRDRYWDLLDQPDVLLIELGFGEPRGQPFHGATKNPGEWLTILESDHRDIFLFALSVDKTECLRRVKERGDLSAEAAANAWDRYAPGAVCSTALFTSRLQPPRSEKVLNTQIYDLDTTIKVIINTTVSSG